MAASSRALAGSLGAHVTLLYLLQSLLLKVLGLASNPCLLGHLDSVTSTQSPSKQKEYLIRVISTMPRQKEWIWELGVVLAMNRKIMFNITTYPVYQERLLG